MAYKKVDSSNITYQPRLNILQLMIDSFSDKQLPIYERFPDLTARGQGRFPFMVLPLHDLTLSDDVTLKTNIQYTNSISGEIYHNYDKLGDDALRQLSSELLVMFTKRNNKKLLASYGITEVDIQIEQQQPEVLLRDQLKIVSVSFTIDFQLDVNMGA